MVGPEVRILVVNPHAGDGDMTADVFAAAGENRPTILSGVVTRREVIREIASGQYDAVHFAAHGDADALAMSNGMLDYDQLEGALTAAALKGKRLNVLVLNACNSINSAVALYSLKYGPGHVISWRYDVRNDAAVLFAERFYSGLSLMGDIHRAYELACNAVERLGVELPLLLNGRTTVLERMLAEISRDLAEIRDTVSITIARRNQYIILAAAVIVVLLLFIAVAWS